MDINEIFKDLGMMIHEQGDVIGKLCSLYFVRRKQAPCRLPAAASQARVTPSSLSFGPPTDKTSSLAVSKTHLVFGSYWLK